MEKITINRMTKDTDQSSLLNFLPICCPLCKGQLSRNSEVFNCNHCEKTYPIVLGIPDLRIFGDPYLGFEDDYKRVQLIVENIHRFDFPGLLEFYWSNSPETPKHLRKRFIRNVLTAESREEAILTKLNSGEGCGRNRPKDVLEIGCGTGGLLVSAARKYPAVVGTDIALRWLIVAKKRFKEAGINIPLICCCAEHLPFPDESFDLVVAGSTLEHTRYQEQVVSESHRVLCPGGRFFLSTPNRYSVTVEPHTYLWGIGFLPRSWMHGYVKYRKGMDYKKIRLLSFFELQGMLRKGFQDVCFSLPDIDDASLAYFNRWRRFQVRIYRWLCKVSIAKAFLLLFGPMYHILCRKKGADAQELVLEEKIAYFDSVADKYFQRYDEYSPVGYAFSVRKQRVMELLDISGGRVLDVGCGPGIMVKELVAMGYEFFGVDASPKMIEQCHENFAQTKGARFSIGDATDLKFPDGFFDLVICMGVIDRIEEYELAIKEMLRVTKKDGVFIIAFGNPYSPHTAWRKFVFSPAVNLLRPAYYSFLRHSQPPALSLFLKLHSEREAVELVKKYSGAVTDTVYFCYNVFLSPLDMIFPRLTTRVAGRLEQYRSGRLRWLGNAFILKVRKI